MGHYASEMGYFSKEEQERQSRQWKLQRKLRNVPLSIFTVSEFTLLVKITGNHYLNHDDLRNSELDILEQKVEKWEKEQSRS